MSTLIAVYNSDGCVGRCDAKCYEATTPICDCICRGKNHGVGLKKAIDNTREMAEKRVEKYAKSQRLDNYKAEIAQEVTQLRMWPGKKI